MLDKRLTVLIRGAGEVASGVAHRLFRSHFQVCLTEVARPLAVCRGNSFCEAVYEGEKEVEGVTARLVTSAKEIPRVWDEGKIPLIIDPDASVREVLHPDVLVDAIMAKKNLGTRIDDAPLVIGLGPGFFAGRDVHVVVETNWSENLGRIILEGEAEEDTGVPIPIGGLTFERVLRAPADGLFQTDKDIGDSVVANEVVGWVGGEEIRARVGGVLRGLLRHGIEVEKGTKLGEIDPVADRETCFQIRPKMRAISGAVLEAILAYFNT